MRTKSLILFGLILCAMLSFQGYCASNRIQITGKILALGNEPFVKIAIQETAEPRSLFVIKGSFISELKHLQGATLEIRGNINGNEPTYQAKILEVISYRIKAIGEGPNSKVPWVGVLSGNPLALKAGKNRTYALEGPLVATLQKYTGAKLWLTGASRSTGFLWWKRTFLIPDAYGIIRSN